MPALPVVLLPSLHALQPGFSTSDSFPISILLTIAWPVDTSPTTCTFAHVQFPRSDDQNASVHHSLFEKALLPSLHDSIPTSVYYHLRKFHFQSHRFDHNSSCFQFVWTSCTTHRHTVTLSPHLLPSLTRLNPKSHNQSCERLLSQPILHFCKNPQEYRDVSRTYIAWILDFYSFSARRCMRPPHNQSLHKWGVLHLSTVCSLKTWFNTFPIQCNIDQSTSRLCQMLHSYDFYHFILPENQQNMWISRCQKNSKIYSLWRPRISTRHVGRKFFTFQSWRLSSRQPLEGSITTSRRVQTR